LTGCGGRGLQRAAEMAQIIWQLNEYEKINLQMKILEHYFLNGDEYSLLETIKEARLEVSPVVICQMTPSSV